MVKFGSDADDTLSGDSEIYGGNGNDRLNGAASDDAYFGGHGNDIVLGIGQTFSGAGLLISPFVALDNTDPSGTDTLSGGSGTDLLVGGDGNDILLGDDGDDSGTVIFQSDRYYQAGLFGGSGTDVLDGGEGNDLLDGGSGADTLDGGEGLDVASYYFNAAISFSLDGSTTASGDIIGDTLLSIEGLAGSDVGNDVLGGDADANWLIGNGGNDTLSGKAGDDLIDGGNGNDQLGGGTGNDTISSGVGRDIVSGGTGTDTLSFFNEAGATYALDGSFAQAGAATDDTLSGFENLIGSNVPGGNDKLAGNSLANWMSGENGDDALSGRSGNDTLSGGEGTDSLAGQSGNDVLAGGSGSDNINGGTGLDTASYLSDGAVAISLDGTIASGLRIGAAIGDRLTSIENLSGSDFGNDWLVGNGGSNTIHGNGGADRLTGQRGNDTVTGGIGGDTISGNSGNDQLSGDSGNDTLNGGSGKDKIDGGSGKDVVSYSGAGASVKLALDGSFAAAGLATTDTLKSIEGIIGTSFADRLAGNKSANILIGGGGKDMLFGRAGNDVLAGGSRADALTGGSGNDTLKGGTGADRLSGGSGKDTASYVDEGAVTVALDGSVAQTGAAAGDTFSSIENVTGSGGDDRLAGNASGNQLNGGDGNDVLLGKSGDDVLTGGVGADVMTGGSDSDRFHYSAINQGEDTITDFNRVSDLLTFTSSALGGLARGGLLSANFVARTGNTAIATVDQFVFNTTTDELWFDADGFFGAASVRIATLSGLTLSADDILIV